MNESSGRDVKEKFSGVKLGCLELENPVIPAAGTYGFESIRFVNPNLLGAVTTRSITLHPQEGSASLRMVASTSGLLTAMEIQSAGMNAFIQNELPEWRRFSVPLVVNLAGKSEEEYCEMVTLLAKEKGVSAIELNLAYHYQHLKSSFLENLADLVAKIKGLTSLPIIAKLFPFCAFELLAKRCEEAGADILSLVHGYPGTAVDLRTGNSKPGDGWAILSGPAIKPLALAMVRQIRQAVRVPLIGMGGIVTPQDALEFLKAGASAVAVGTANLVNPRAMTEILADLSG